MARRMWTVQVEDWDGLFHTVQDGTHSNLSTAYAQYESLTGTRLLLRGDHIVLRSDMPVTELAHDPLF